MPVYRAARPAPGWWNLTKTLAQTLVFWSLFLGVVPWLLKTFEDAQGIPGFGFAGQRAVAGLGFVLFGAVGLWSGITMALSGQGTPLPNDAARLLVVDGPYRYLRNPMATAGLGQGAMVGVLIGSWGVLAYVFAGFVVWNWTVRSSEERDLKQRFGKSFEDYRAEIRCWIPTFPGYRTSTDE